MAFTPPSAARSYPKNKKKKIHLAVLFFLNSSPVIILDIQQILGLHHNFDVWGDNGAEHQSLTRTF